MNRQYALNCFRVVRGFLVPATRPPIGQPLTFDALEGNGGALEVGDLPVRIAEVKFVEVTL